MASNSNVSNSVDAMAARLASSLALAEGKRAVDLRPSQGQGLRQSAAFMLGKLLTSREYKMRSLLGMFKSAWQVDGTLQVEEVEEKRILFTLSDPNDRDRIWKGGPWGFNRAPVALAMYDGVADPTSVSSDKASYWITLQNIPATFRTPRVMMMIGFTLGNYKEYDKPAKKAGKLIIRVEIPLNRPLPLKRWYTLEDGVEACCHFRYARLFGRCTRCGLVTHFGLPCAGPELNEDDPGAQQTGLGTGMVVNSAAAPPPGFHAGEASTSIPNPTFRVSETLADMLSNPNLGVGSSTSAAARQEETVVFKAVREPTTRVRKKTPARQVEAGNEAGALVVVGQRRAREEEEGTEVVSPKKAKLSLAVGKQHLHLSPNRLGLLKRVIETQISKRRGRPVGSKNKQAYGTKKQQEEARKKKKQEEAKKKRKRQARRNLEVELEEEAAEEVAAESVAAASVASGGSPDPKGKGKA